MVDRRSHDDLRRIGLHSKGKLSREFEFKLFSIASWNPYFVLAGGSPVTRRSARDWLAFEGAALRSRVSVCVRSCQSRCPPGESVHDDLRRIGLHSKAPRFDLHRTIYEGLVCIQRRRASIPIDPPGAQLSVQMPPWGVSPRRSTKDWFASEGAALRSPSIRQALSRSQSGYPLARPMGIRTRRFQMQINLSQIVV
jgi:hypothetical protein